MANKYKYKIVRYHRSGSLFSTNGGKLIVTEKEYVVKYLFLTVARFEIDKTLASRIPTHLLSKGICLDDGKKDIDLYFSGRTADKLYQMLGI